jgi:hypothetical protein
MEDTTKITKKVVNPATTVKEGRKPNADGTVLVRYTRKSVKYPGEVRMPRGLAETLQKSGKVEIINE